MTIVRRDRLEAFWNKHSEAERPLLAWIRATERANWNKPTDVKQSWTVDVAVRVDSGRRVAVFDIGGNKYRLVVEMQYRAGIAWVKFIGTHACYDEIDVETVNDY